MSTIMDFSVINKAVQAQFAKMMKSALFFTEVTRDQLWDTYLASFPEGTNPIYRERTEHDCQCCRQFIRQVGNVVAIADGKLVSIWDIKVDVEGYQVVANAMAKLVKAAAVKNVFLTTEKTAGALQSFEDVIDGTPVKWSHFFANIPSQCVVVGKDIGTKQSESSSTYDVFYRGMTEIPLSSVDLVIELIEQKSLYRGEEHLGAIKAFRKLHREFSKLKTKKAQKLFCWGKVPTDPTAILRLRNTMVGTLLVALAEGKEVDAAVNAFEGKAEGYKRPTSIATPRMVEGAKKTVEELGFTTSLPRRMAVMDDITVENVLYADRTAKEEMDVFAELAAETTTVSLKKFDKVAEVGIEEFLSKILPTAKSLEILMENGHAANIVNLIAPVDPTAKGMFKWDNNFSWAYSGDIADSLRAKVASLGGRVDGALRFTHTWN